MARAPTRATVAFVLDRARAADVRTAVLDLLDAFGADLDVASADTLATALESSSPERDDALLRSVGGGSAARAYVQARLLAAWGDSAAALASLDAALKALASPHPALLVLRSRWLLAAGSLESAARDLRLALQLEPPYSLFVRAERLVAKLVASEGWKPRRRCRLALLSSSTTALLAPVLRACLFRDGIAADVYEGSYGAFRQEILDAGSALYAFAPEVVVLLVNHRDLAVGPRDGWGLAEGVGAELRNLWKTLQERLPCHVIQSTVDVPRGGAWGALEDGLAEGRRRTVARFNLALSEALPPGVSLLNLEALPGARELASDEEWATAKQFPRADALPSVADAIAAQVRAVLGLSRKVLVTDLDDTLWGGIIGEDGLAGIKVGPPSADGEGYAELQSYMKELRARGVVLAVCSKNNLADAEAPFRQHDAMRLRLEDFVAFKASWDDKPTNLRAIAAELSLGLDSFVFLDDNPFERAHVRERLPDVLVPEVEPTPWSMLRALRRGMYFEAVALTSEDVVRNASYAAGAAIRTAQQGASGTIDEFLSGLGMTSEHGAVDESTLQRVTQLVNKTNQFNVTTRRYTLEQVRQMASSREWWCHGFKLADRFGDHGLVGVMFVRDEGRDWFIDSWLMSCRVLGRRMEDFMLASLVSEAKERGAHIVRGQYLPTDKNGMVKDLFPRLGFAEEGAGAYRLDLDAAVLPASPWIRGTRVR
jgi:FkbH-like protein